MIDDTTPEAVLARRVRDQILFHPESHQQDIWAVGVVVGQREMGGEYRGHYMDIVEPVRGCVAGWTCHLNGDEMHAPQRGHDYVIDESEREMWDRWLERTYRDGALPHVSKVVPAGGRRSSSVVPRAAELLGLDRSEWQWLFADERSREEVLHGLDLLGKGDRKAFARLMPGDGDGEGAGTT